MWEKWRGTANTKALGTMLLARQSNKEESIVTREQGGSKEGDELRSQVLLGLVDQREEYDFPWGRIRAPRGFGAREWHELIVYL